MPYGSQPYIVYQVGHGNREAEDFALEIHKALTDCGWKGTVCYGIEDGSVHLHSGIALFLEVPEGGAWPGQTAEALGALQEELRAAKFGEGSAFANPRRLPTGVICVVVGAKP